MLGIFFPWHPTATQHVLLSSPTISSLAFLRQLLTSLNTAKKQAVIRFPLPVPGAESQPSVALQVKRLQVALQHCVTLSPSVKVQTAPAQSPAPRVVFSAEPPTDVVSHGCRSCPTIFHWALKLLAGLFAASLNSAALCRGAHEFTAYG